MLDIVEIALSKYTDYKGFERLACEIARNEGYPNIQPLGGVHDGGKDGEQNPLFYAQGKRQRIIFQISIEDDAINKVRRTLKRLVERNEKFDTLVYITSRTVTTIKQDEIKLKMRKEFDVPIEIISRETIVSRLSDYSNGMFNRFFPNIDAQINDLRQQKAASPGEITEAALLRTALTLNFGDSSQAAHDVTFDHLVLAVLSHSYPTTLTHDEVIVEMKKICTACEYSSDSIRDAFERLSQKGFIHVEDNKARASKSVMDSGDMSIIRSESALDSLVDDIINTMSEECEKSIDPLQDGLLRRNCREILIDFLRVFGREMINIASVEDAASPVFAGLIPEIVSKAKRDVPDDKGNLLVACMAEVVGKPNRDQACQISSLSLSYVGAAILRLDPLLQELSAQKLANKTFVLDTDIIISALVCETPMSDIYTSFVNRLATSGASVIIPTSCVHECTEHARYSYKTYNFFRERLLALPEATVSQQVWNGFVQGYYFGMKSGALPQTMTYSKYIKNYLETGDAFRFMCEALKARFHDSVTIQDMDDLLPPEDIPETVRQELEANIYEQLSQGAKKAEYRTDGETWDLARTDAKLFLGVYYLNSRHDMAQNSIIPGSHYLITSSGRYMSAAHAIGLKAKVTTRLQPLVSTLKALGRIDISPSEFMRLIENPFLQLAVSSARADILGLIEAGVNLTGVSLPRLRRDLDAGLHEKITSLQNNREKYDDGTPDTTDNSDAYLSLIQDATKRGYTLSAGANNLIQGLEASKNDYEKRIKMVDEYMEEVKKFSKRKQKYLRRMRTKMGGKD